MQAYKIKQFLIKCINNYKIKKSAKSLKLFKNKYKGKRCFIIGNGPSLKKEDLEKLKDEICFGTHRIYHIFKETSWRPLFYCAQDSALINESIKEINNMDIKDKFIAINPGCSYNKIKNGKLIRLFCENFYPQLPKLSTDIEKGIYEGYTVSYMCLQIAFYMGFSEIYLLGVDHSYSKELNSFGETETKEGLQDHFSKEDKIANIPQTYKSVLAYKAAEEYAKRNNIKIYNATRGGVLEVFKRIEFDKIFTGEDL